jgi:hypothetical protein
MKNLTKKPAPTFESVWALLQENAKKMAESRADFDQRMKETDRRIEKSREDYERRMKKMEETMGSWTYNHGSFAEEYFFNSFESGQQDFFGERFDKIEKNIKNSSKTLQDEYDIVMYNGAYVAIIEVKYKAHKNDLPIVLKKADTFRILCPDYKDSKIYLGLASMSFYPELEQECIKQGIAVIKQVGDTVVINDAHLKVF